MAVGDIVLTTKKAIAISEQQQCMCKYWNAHTIRCEMVTGLMQSGISAKTAPPAKE